jgi:anion-transporting  ArsA/GET3 family ATPase
MRTIVVELSNQERVQRAFSHRDAHFEELELAPRLFTISVDAQRAMEEYLRVKTGPLGQVIGSSRIFAALAMATPGMRELLSMGKVWELTQLQRRTRGAGSYDLVIVDAPATGHGVGILRTPRTFADIARVGPIARQARQIQATIEDRKLTAVVAVATPEEMPVNETLSLRDALGREGFALDLVIANAVYPSRFEAAHVGKLEHALAGTDEPLARAAVRAALSEHARSETQGMQLERLRAGLNVTGRIIELPFVFSETVGQPELERLADVLDARL